MAATNMLKHIVLLVLLIQILVSCHPTKDEYMYLDNTAAITATLVNPKDTIALGDSILMTFEVPDSIVFNDTKVKASFVTEKKDGFGLGFMPAEMDSTLELVQEKFPRDFTFYANPGKITNNANK